MNVIVIAVQLCFTNDILLSNFDCCFVAEDY